eukprot:4463180-Amphidinium_carterae.1
MASSRRCIARLGPAGGGTGAVEGPYPLLASGGGSLAREVTECFYQQTLNQDCKNPAFAKPCYY